jgi:hypothetical protein
MGKAVTLARTMAFDMGYCFRKVEWGATVRLVARSWRQAPRPAAASVRPRSRAGSPPLMRMTAEMMAFSKALYRAPSSSLTALDPKSVRSQSPRIHRRRLRRAPALSSHGAVVTPPGLDSFPLSCAEPSRIPGATLARHMPGI